jgi:hypothetical protein
VPGTKIRGGIYGGGGPRKPSGGALTAAIFGLFWGRAKKKTNFRVFLHFFTFFFEKTGFLDKSVV